MKGKQKRKYKSELKIEKKRLTELAKSNLMKLHIKQEHAI